MVPARTFGAPELEQLADDVEQASRASRRRSAGAIA
jgi:hypothetical protein